MSSSSSIYIEASEQTKELLRKHGIAYNECRKSTAVETIDVLEVLLQPDEFKPFIFWFERETKHRVALYDADLSPEMQYMIRNDLRPFDDTDPSELTKCNIEVRAHNNFVLQHVPITLIACNDTVLEGKENEILSAFVDLFNKLDPDVLIMEHAFSRLPYLVQRLAAHNLAVNFHRWDPMPITYRGGRSFFSYGQVKYRDFAIRLHGRLLIDASMSFCDFEGLVELSQLCGERVQHIASRSPGAVYQFALLREMAKDHLLIPYKQLLLNPAVTLSELLKADRAGHTMDPIVGFHRDVAELDFMSMFPYLMYTRNISAEMLYDNTPPFEYAPGLPIRISVAKKGLVPRAIKPFLDRRMHYKRNPSPENRAKINALKTVLVCSNGYLRFREFKLGLARTHMALCAYARETMIQAQHIAEEQGFDVLHSIVDSLYVRKNDMARQDVEHLRKEIEMICGIPLAYEGTFKWIVFLTSVNDPHRRLPARYFGVYDDGKIKARGIEVRQRGPPLIVRAFQQECLEKMAQCDTKLEIAALAPVFGALVRSFVRRLPKLHRDWLCSKVRLGTTAYKHDVPQKRLVQTLQSKGYTIAPGQSVKFIMTTRGAVLAEDYRGNVDLQHYKNLFLRALFVILQPFGFSRQQLLELSGYERQLSLLPGTQRRVS